MSICYIDYSLFVRFQLKYFFLLVMGIILVSCSNSEDRGKKFCKSVFLSEISNTNYLYKLRTGESGAHLLLNIEKDKLYRDFILKNTSLIQSINKNNDPNQKEYIREFNNKLTSFIFEKLPEFGNSCLKLNNSIEKLCSSSDDKCKKKIIGSEKNNLSNYFFEPRRLYYNEIMLKAIKTNDLKYLFSELNKAEVKWSTKHEGFYSILKSGFIAEMIKRNKYDMLLSYSKKVSIDEIYGEDEDYRKTILYSTKNHVKYLKLLNYPVKSKEIKKDTVAYSYIFREAIEGFEFLASSQKLIVDKKFLKDAYNLSIKKNKVKLTEYVLKKEYNPASIENFNNSLVEDLYLFEDNQHRFLEIIKLHLKYNIDLKKITTNSYNILCKAISYNYYDTVDYLLKNKIFKLNTKSCDSPALVYAVSGGHIDMIKLLLKHGADPKFKVSKYSSSAFERAMNSKNPILRSILGIK